LTTAPLTSIPGDGRYRIIASLAKGLAAYNTAKSQQKPAPGTMDFDGLNGIAGAGRSKTTAGGKKRRKEITIAPDQT